MAMSEQAGEEPSMALKKAAALSAANAVTRESGKIPMTCIWSCYRLFRFILWFSHILNTE